MAMRTLLSTVPPCWVNQFTSSVWALSDGSTDLGGHVSLGVLYWGLGDDVVGFSTYSEGVAIFLARQMCFYV